MAGGLVLMTLLVARAVGDTPPNVLSLEGRPA